MTTKPCLLKVHLKSFPQLKRSFDRNGYHRQFLVSGCALFVLHDAWRTALPHKKLHPLPLREMNMLDLEQLALFIEMRKMQTLEWETEQGQYTLRNSVPRPAYWSVSFTLKGMPLQPARERRGLKAIIGLIEAEYPLFYAHLLERFPKNETKPLDVSDVAGYAHVKWCLEISASGGHHVLLVGYPGKDLMRLAEAFKLIWQSLDQPEKKKEVLFLDLNSFDQEGLLTIRRAIETETQWIIATVRPCPCGYYDDPAHSCGCNPGDVAQHQQALHEMLRTCFALEVWVPSVPLDGSIAPDVAKMFPPDDTTTIRRRVEQVRGIQQERYRGTDLWINADLHTQEEVERYCGNQTVQSGQDLIRMATQKLQLSPEEVQHLWEVSRTIADMDDSSWIKGEHVAKAIVYRSRFSRDA
jgi:hypothetical protein